MSSSTVPVQILLYRVVTVQCGALRDHQRNYSALYSSMLLIHRVQSVQYKRGNKKFLHRDSVDVAVHNCLLSKCSFAPSPATINALEALGEMIQTRYKRTLPSESSTQTRTFSCHKVEYRSIQDSLLYLHIVRNLAYTKNQKIFRSTTEP